MSSQAQHYYWAGGHGLMFFTGMRYLLAWTTFRAGSLGWWYKGPFCVLFIPLSQTLGLLSVHVGALDEGLIVSSYAAAFFGALISYFIVVK